MEKFYLGISISHNSSACILSSERGLLAAISEERINGEKNTKKVPYRAAIKCIELAGTKRIDGIAISHYEEISEDYFKRYGNLKDDVSWRKHLIYFLRANDIRITDDTIVRVNHHEAHALSTFAFYDYSERYYTITSDGFGDGHSAQIKLGDKLISTVPLKNSIALVYQFVTGALGYTELKHEGKITGLAAFGEPKYLSDFESLYDYVVEGNFIDFRDSDYSLTEEELEQVKTSKIIDFDKFLLLKKAIYRLVNNLTAEGAKPEDIAASVQEFAETHTLLWILKNCTECDMNAYLAGGLFANVKINQRIKDLGIFKNVYVCPAMGDEGTAIGAAIAIAGIPKQKISPNQCGMIAEYDEVNHWFDVLCMNKLAYKLRKIDDNDELVGYIADKLSNDKIVCLVKGKMEFGPRALCHRSILYNCNTKETNTWLNDKLGRTEFMPFAPVTREEVADDLFINLDGGRDSAKHMTMTFNCTEEFVQNYPAACHIDNTARPQIVSHDEDPFIWSVLERYQNMTGKKALINTSFNLHNNPIIASTEVAISSWLTSDTDVLVIGNTVIEKVG